MRGWRSAEFDGVSKQSAFDDLFKRRHFPAEIIILCVRWYPQDHMLKMLIPYI